MRISSSRLILAKKSSRARSKRSAMSMCQVCLRKLDQSKASETRILIQSPKIKIRLFLRLLTNLYNNKIPLKLRKIKRRRIKTKIRLKINYNNKCQILKMKLVLQSPLKEPMLRRKISPTPLRKR